MEKQVLSREQMQELIDMGIDTSKASMCWIIYEDGDYEVGTEDLAATLSLDYTIEKTTPTFTLQDIMQMIQSAKCLKPGHLMTLVFAGDKNYITTNIYDPDSHRSYGDTPLEAAFNMLKWCKQNNYI